MTPARPFSRVNVRAPQACRQRVADGAGTLLGTSDLSVNFGSFKALRGVSLQSGFTGVHAVIGPNGAGKTTLFNALSGFVKPASGTVHFNGIDVTGAAADRLARLGVARSFQICSIFPNLSVGDNLRMALVRDTTACGFLRRHSGSEALEAHAEELLESTSLGGERHRRAADLSYGRRRLLEIITTMALRPKLLLLDEPMAGLAREDIPPVVALIAKAARNCSVLLVEHNLKVVETLAARVTVMAEGAVLCEGTYGEVAQDPRVVEAYIGAELDA
jgi:branched-chain amino acid transport system ATP-binding protein